MNEPEQRKDPYPWIAAAAYLVLLSPYLLCWSHVQYVIDDWFLMRHFRSAAQAGVHGVTQLAGAAAQNRVYGVFRTQWLSVLYGFFVTWLGGYSPRFNFTLLLLLHAACAWLLCQTMWRLGAGRTVSFLAGALYLLAPTTHFALFTYLTVPFFVLSTFWTLLLLWWIAGVGPQRGAISAVVLPACFAVAALFSGEQVFLLLWAAPLLVVVLFRKDERRRAWVSVAAIWGALAVAATAYVLWINRAPMRQAGFDRRYEWTWAQLKANALALAVELSRLTGLRASGAFHISPAAGDLALALALGAAVAALVWLWRIDEAEGKRLERAWLFAVAGVLLAYGPVLLIAGAYSRLRYHYVPSPYLGLGAAVLCWALASSGRGHWLRASAGGLLTAYFALNAAADIRQCWIPQSEQHVALTAALKGLRDVAPGDLLIISGTPYEIGTAQHFTMHSSVSANPFAEWATGVAPLEVGLEVQSVHGHLVLFQRDYQRPLLVAELARTHVMVSWDGGKFSSCDWIAQEVEPDRFRLFALKGATAPPGTFSREQLALLEGHIYFAGGGATRNHASL